MRHAWREYGHRTTTVGIIRCTQYTDDLLCSPCFMILAKYPIYAFTESETKALTFFENELQNLLDSPWPIK